MLTLCKRHESQRPLRWCPERSREVCNPAVWMRAQHKLAVTSQFWTYEYVLKPVFYTTLSSPTFACLPYADVVIPNVWYIRKALLWKDVLIPNVRVLTSYIHPKPERYDPCVFTTFTCRCKSNRLYTCLKHTSRKHDVPCILNSNVYIKHF
jgi:hypothetical protein